VGSRFRGSRKEEVLAQPKRLPPLRQGRGSPCVLLPSQEQITPDVQAQLHQLPLEF
jgi:hypothetical protein